MDKKADFSEWYRHTLIEGNFIRYHNVSGCYVLLPNSFCIWERIQGFLDMEFKKRGVKNAYFPMFLAQSDLYKEKDHLEGFTPEVAWVTCYGDIQDKENLSHMEEPVAIRPTSETIMYPVFKDILTSHHDLPYKINQWCNVVRWEFKDPTPFIRSREFLWNEGHTVYSTQAEADFEVNDIITLYKRVYEELLAVPAIKGTKTESEKFPGGEFTKTVECFVEETGKAIQGATSHSLGQKFSKIFNILVQNNNGINVHPWQNSWGLTTRSIGTMLMVHGDNKGCVLPPLVAQEQIVIVPVIFKKQKEETLKYIDQIYNSIKSNFRVKYDVSKHNPGWKYNYWELRGVPLRLEIGPKDMENNTVMIYRRDTDSKETYDVNTTDLNTLLGELLVTVQTDMFNSAQARLMNNIHWCSSVETMDNHIKNKKIIYTYWCGKESCEETVKNKTGAKSLCIPDDDLLDQGINIDNKETVNTICIVCKEESNIKCLFGKSF